MIWQLMKRDPAWIVAPFLPVLFVIPAFRNPQGAIGLGIESLIFIAIFSQGLRTNCTLYEAALPIRGRDLWLARVLALLALLWLPVLATSGILVGLKTPPAPLIEVSAVYSVLMLGAKCIRIGEFALPRWMNPVGLVTIVASGTLVPIFMNLANLPPAGEVLGACGLLGAALFVTGLSRVPESFQIAPESAGSSGRPMPAKGSHFMWSPVWASLARWRWYALLLTANWMFIGARSLQSVSMLPFLPMIRDRLSWLFALPISMRRLFAMIALPCTAAMALGEATNVFFPNNHAVGIKERIIGFALNLALFYFITFLVELLVWRRLSKLVPWIRGLPLMVALAGIVLGIWRTPDDLFRGPILLLALDWRVLAIALTVLVVGTYWLAERAFIEQEIGRRVTKEQVFD